MLAFEAVRNTAWIGLVALAVLPPLVDRLRESPAEEPARLNRILSRDDPRRARHRGRRRGGEADELVHERIPDAASASSVDGGGPAGTRLRHQPLRRLAALEPAEARGPGRVRRPLRAPLDRRSSSGSRVSRREPATGRRRRAAIGVFVLDPRTDRALEQSLRRTLRARVVFSSPQVVVLRRRG